MNKARSYLVASGCFFGVLVTDILVAKFQVMAGINAPVHLGDTAQFLVLLVSVTFFVIGALHKEKQATEETAADNQTAGDGPTDP